MPFVDEHRLLARGEGTFTLVTRGFTENPEGTVLGSGGQETCRILEGGLWAIADRSYDLPGGSYRTHTVLGYDPRKGKYIGVWVDSADSTMTVLEGDYDRRTDTLTMTPVQGTERAGLKHVYAWRPDGSSVFSMVGSPPGRASETMTTLLQLTLTPQT